MSKGKRGPRFTGRWPTADALRKYPNWEYALDEEGRAGHDESTMRPSDSQTLISGFTSLTAVVARGPGRARFHGFLHGAYNELRRGEAEATELYLFDGRHVRTVRVYGGRWTPEDPGPSLDYLDFEKLPLHVESVRPSGKLGRKLQLVLMPDGVLRTGKTARPPKPEVMRWLKPGDLEFRDRGHLSRPLIGTVFNVTGRRRRRIGKARTDYSWVDGKRAIKMRAVTDYVDKVDDYEVHCREFQVVDARTLELRAGGGTMSGRRWNLAIDKAGRDRLPRGTMALDEISMPSVDLAIGQVYAVKDFSMWQRRTITFLYRVEAIESAPGHVRSRAWRISYTRGGPTMTHVWFDVATGRALARRHFGLDKDVHLDHLTIYRP